MNAPEVSTNLLCVPSRDSRADSICDTLDNVADCLSLVHHALRDNSQAVEFGHWGMVLLLDLVADAIQFARNVAAGNEAAHELVLELSDAEFARLRECAAGGPIEELAAAIIADALNKRRATN